MMRHRRQKVERAIKIDRTGGPDTARVLGRPARTREARHL